RAIETGVLETLIVVGEDGERIAGLECNDCIQLPAFRYFSHQGVAVAERLIDGERPGTADYETVSCVEVREAAIEAVIQRVGLPRRTCAEAGLDVNSLRQRVSPAQTEAVVETLIDCQLQFVTR